MEVGTEDMLGYYTVCVLGKNSSSTNKATKPFQCILEQI